MGEELKNKYINNVYYMEYLSKVAYIESLFVELNQLINIDCLDIDYSSYVEKLRLIEREMRNSNKNREICQLYIDKLNSLILDVSKELEPLHIVELYLKSINDMIKNMDSSLDEIMSQAQKLIYYIEDLRLFKEDEYQKVLDTYGNLEDKVLLQLIELSDNQSSKR